MHVGWRPEAFREGTRGTWAAAGAAGSMGIADGASDASRLSTMPLAMNAPVSGRDDWRVSAAMALSGIV